MSDSRPIGLPPALISVTADDFTDTALAADSLVSDGVGSVTTFVDTALDPNPPVSDRQPEDASDIHVHPLAAATARPVRLGMSSALDEVLPVAYGPQKVRGLLYAHKESSGMVYQVYVLCLGEQVSCSASDVMIGSKSLSEWYSSGFVGQYEIKLGSATQTQATILGTIMAGTDVPTTTLPGYCYIALSFRKSYSGPFPSTLEPVAIVGGKKITDFRDSSTGAFVNPILVANDIMTDRDSFPGFNDLPDGSPRWTASDYEWIADRCDEIMSDGTKRFEYAGLITQRSAREALREVLSHCFCDWYLLGSDVKIVPDLLPEQVPGVWSATASSTLTGSTGSATGYGPDTDADSSGVTVGSRLLLVSGLVVSVLAVDSVSTPNTITIDQGVTISNEVVRHIAKQHISANEGGLGWITGPDEADVDPASAPSVVKVVYTNAETYGRAAVRAEDPDGYTAVSAVKTEIVYEGCRHASNAMRLGTQLRRTPQLCPFSWSGLAGPDAAGLEPGDVVTFDSSTLDHQLAIVLSSTARLDNTYQLGLREFDVGVYSDDVADDDTDPSGITPPSAPDLPTGVEQKFIYRGDLDSYNELADPDDLTGDFAPASCLLSYDASNDWSIMTPTGATPSIKTGEILFSGAVPERSILVFLYQLHSGSPLPSSSEIIVDYYAGPSGSMSLQESVTIGNEQITSGWNMVSIIVNNDATAVAHALKISILNQASGFPTINFRRMFWIPATQIPFLGIRQLFNFTEASGAPDTVLKYLATFSDAEGNTIDGPSVPQGNDHLSVPIIVAGEPPEGPSVRLGYDLFAVGGWGRKQATISTQVIQDVNMGAVIDSIKNVDGSGKAAGNIAVIGSDADTMEFQTLAAADVAAASDLSSHEADETNPHAVTAAQVGAPPTSRTISPGSGLTGGGDLSADRTVGISASGVQTTHLANGAVTALKRESIAAESVLGRGSTSGAPDAISGQDIAKAITAGTAGKTQSINFVIGTTTYTLTVENGIVTQWTSSSI